MFVLKNRIHGKTLGTSKKKEERIPRFENFEISANFVFHSVWIKIHS